MPATLPTHNVVANENGSWLCLFEPHSVAAWEYATAIVDLPPELDGFRILHISDLHLRRKWYRSYDTIIDRVAQLKVDLILCTGDIVDDKHTHAPAMANVLRFLPALKSRLGMYTILGNHDNLQLGKELEQNGIPLVNGQRYIDTGQGKLELIGTPGILRADLPRGFAQKFPPRNPVVPRIVMAHYPDHWAHLSALDPDIYLCGHTHGGQICLPGGFPILRHDSSPRQFCRGYNRRGRTHFIVNHGLGFSGIPMRLFCPPELVIVRLTRPQPLRPPEA